MTDEDKFNSLTQRDCQILCDFNPFVQSDGNAGEFLFEIECNLPDYVEHSTSFEADIRSAS
jgi:hypothetical protein